MPFFTRRGSKFSRIWHCVASFTIISFQTLTCLDHGCAISFSFTAWSSLWCSKLTFELRSLKALADVLWCQWCKACCWVGCRELDADVQDKFVMSTVNQGRWECWHTKPWCVSCERLNSNSRSWTEVGSHLLFSAHTNVWCLYLIKYISCCWWAKNLSWQTEVWTPYSPQFMHNTIWNV